MHGRRPIRPGVFACGLPTVSVGAGIGSTPRRKDRGIVGRGVHRHNWGGGPVSLFLAHAHRSEPLQRAATGISDVACLLMARTHFSEGLSAAVPHERCQRARLDSG